MRGPLILPSSGWRLVPAMEISAEGGFARIDPSVAGSKIDQWSRDPAVWPDLHRLYEEVSGSYLRPPTARDVEHVIRPFLRRALERGQVVALVPTAPQKAEAKSERGVHMAKAIVEPPPKPDVPRVLRVIPEKAPAPELSFIEIALVDEDGEPLAGQSYELVLANGEVRRGSLDDQGAARIEGIPAGNCQVKFPDVDGREWQHAKSESAK